MIIRISFSLLLIAVLGLVAASGVHAQKQEFPDVTVEGLHLVPDSKLAVVYAEPGADLSTYKRIQLLDAYVAFRKNWERDQKSRSATSFRINSKDIEQIKNSLAAEFQTVFKNALEEAGFKITEESGEDVMIIRPAIINLDITAPDTPHVGRINSFTYSAGEMTLYIELYDSLTGDIVVKALDRRVDRSTAGFYTWTNSVTNRSAAQRILKGWAKILVSALSEANTYGSEPDGDS